MSASPSDWTNFLTNHHAEMKRRTPKRKVSLGEAMKSASKPWKKYKRTLKHKGNERVQGGAALSPASFSETAVVPTTVAGAPATSGSGSGCPFKGGKKGKRSRITRRSRN